MKRFLRILVGLPLCPMPMAVSTWVWLFDSSGESWTSTVGYYTWCLASGDWDKLPE